MMLVGCVGVGDSIPELPSTIVDVENPKFAESSPTSTESVTDVPIEATEIILQEIPETISNTPTRQQVDIKICSPLAEHEVDHLQHIVSSPYSPPPMGKDDRHQGVDFAYYNQEGRASILGEGIQTIFGGWVAAVLEDRLPYGNMVLIETPFRSILLFINETLALDESESLYHLYAHMENPPDFIIGSWIECGAYLGNVGKTGYNIPVAHLHLETRIGPSGWRFNGMAYYDTLATDSERQNYKLWRMSGEFRHFNPMILFTTNNPPE